jgi:hypothetical protein
MEKEITDLRARGATNEEVKSIMTQKYPDKAIQVAELTAGGGQDTTQQLLYKTAL